MKKFTTFGFIALLSIALITPAMAGDTTSSAVSGAGASSNGVVGDINSGNTQEATKM